MSGAVTPWRVRGFTLIEMLVVLMIIGIFLGLVHVNLRPGAQDLLRTEAERLAQLLDLAAEESRLTGKSLAWTADISGYRFWHLSRENEWSEIRDSELLRARSLPQGMTISDLRIEAMGPQRFMRLEFSPNGLALAFSIDLSLGTEHYAIAASPVGDLRVAPGKGKTYGEMVPQ